LKIQLLATEMLSLKFENHGGIEVKANRRSSANLRSKVA